MNLHRRQRSITLLSPSSLGFSPAAFTLIELLVVVAIILILAGLLLTGVQSAIKRADIHKARTAVVGLAFAFRSYEAQNGAWPFPDESTVTGLTVSNNVIKLLQDQKYMEFKSNELTWSSSANEPMFYVDPWGNPYRFICDGNSDGMVTNPFGPSNASIKCPVIVWSAGPDGIWTNDATLGEKSPVNRDNITSY